MSETLCGILCPSAEHTAVGCGSVNCCLSCVVSEYHCDRDAGQVDPNIYPASDKEMHTFDRRV